MNSTRRSSALDNWFSADTSNAFGDERPTTVHARWQQPKVLTVGLQADIHAGRYSYRFEAEGRVDVVTMPPTPGASYAPPPESMRVRKTIASESASEVDHLSDVDKQRIDTERALRASDYPSALVASHEAMRASGSPSDEALHAWVVQLTYGHGTRLHPRAAHYIEHALMRGDDCPITHFYAGSVLKCAGREEEAYEHFKLTLQLDPKHLEARREVRLWERRKGAPTRLR